MTTPDDLTLEEWTLLRAMWPLQTSPIVCPLNSLTLEAKWLARRLEREYITRVSGGYTLTLRGHAAFEQVKQ